MHRYFVFLSPMNSELFQYDVGGMSSDNETCRLSSQSDEYEHYSTCLISTQGIMMIISVLGPETFKSIIFLIEYHFNMLFMFDFR